MIALVPVHLDVAKAFVAMHHRHNGPPLSARWCVGVAVGNELIGVAIVGRPVARALQDGWTQEVLAVSDDQPSLFDLGAS